MPAYCDDLKPHRAHYFKHPQYPALTWCHGRVSHGIERWGDLIDEVDSRQDEAERDADLHDKYHPEERDGGCS